MLYSKTARCARWGAEKGARRVSGLTRATGQPLPDDDEGPEPPYAGYESEAELRRMADERALRAKEG
jgi:hypothetical protein